VCLDPDDLANVSTDYGSEYSDEARCNRKLAVSSADTGVCSAE